MYCLPDFRRRPPDFFLFLADNCFFPALVPHFFVVFCCHLLSPVFTPKIKTAAALFYQHYSF